MTTKLQIDLLNIHLVIILIWPEKTQKPSGCIDRIIHKLKRNDAWKRNPAVGRAPSIGYDKIIWQRKEWRRNCQIANNNFFISNNNILCHDIFDVWIFDIWNFNIFQSKFHSLASNSNINREWFAFSFFHLCKIIKSFFFINLCIHAHKSHTIPYWK